CLLEESRPRGAESRRSPVASGLLFRSPRESPMANEPSSDIRRQLKELAKALVQAGTIAGVTDPKLLMERVSNELDRRGGRRDQANSRDVEEFDREESE